MTFLLTVSYQRTNALHFKRLCEYGEMSLSLKDLGLVTFAIY